MPPYFVDKKTATFAQGLLRLQGAVCCFQTACLFYSIWNTFLETVIYAQAEISAGFRQGRTVNRAAPLAVRFIEFVADVIDG